MTTEQVIEGLERIESRAKELPLRADEWVTIAAAKRILNKNRRVWHAIDDLPTFRNGLTELIVDSNYGHISREAHTYSLEQWEVHVGFQEHRDFLWAYEKDLFE
ncbi:MAG: hypothetical protein J6Y37_03880 [Paludibacteraceae bacterium]|nr:hypothetical protein [Paludibacteraceae bacterium]